VSVIVRAEARTYLRSNDNGKSNGSGKSNGNRNGKSDGRGKSDGDDKSRRRSRFPEGMTERNAMAKATIRWVVAFACCEDGCSRGGVRARG
jgi:hypothetical protein